MIFCSFEKDVLTTYDVKNRPDFFPQNLGFIGRSKKEFLFSASCKTAFLKTRVCRKINFKVQRKQCLPFFATKPNSHNLYHSVVDLI